MLIICKDMDVVSVDMQPYMDALVDEATISGISLQLRVIMKTHGNESCLYHLWVVYKCINNHFASVSGCNYLVHVKENLYAVK